MKASGMLSLLLAASASAAPLALPQWSWPSWAPSGGGSTGGGSTGGGFGGSTANDVSDGVACRPYTVIFARGTSEGGNIGSVIGPKLRSELQKLLGNDGIAFQGVPYPAASSGNFNGGDNGPQLMVQLAQKARSQCPNTKIVVSGYSQGGIVTHNAGKNLASVNAAGAVIFGDPYNGQPVANVAKLKEFCAQGDSICSRKRQTGHLSYGTNAPEAAAWIAAL